MKGATGWGMVGKAWGEKAHVPFARPSLYSRALRKGIQGIGMALGSGNEAGQTTAPLRRLAPQRAVPAHDTASIAPAQEIDAASGPGADGNLQEPSWTARWCWTGKHLSRPWNYYAYFR